MRFTVQNTFLTLQKSNIFYNLIKPQFSQSNKIIVVLKNFKLLFY